MSTPAANLPRVGLIINGLPFVAEPADAGTVLYDIRGRQAVTSTGPDQVISLHTTPVDNELGEMAAARRRVREAAAGPWTPRAERPSARQAAIRRAAREYHAAVWASGYSQAQADIMRGPLDERVTERDIPELIELAMGAVLADPALRAEFVKASEAAEFEELLVSAPTG